MTASAIGVSSARQSEARILVGPNVHVSRESDGPYNETTIAAHPTDPNVLMGAAQAYFGPWHDERQKVWISRDRGQRWEATYLPRDKRWNKGDPAVAFGATGTMFVKFTDQPVRRSDDGGKTWTTASVNDKDSAVWPGDREKLAVDRSNGKHHGRVYAIANGMVRPQQSGDRWLPDLLASSDDGRTFEPAAREALGASRGHYAHVLHDGTVAILISVNPSRADRRLGINLSSDGGRTFQVAGTFPRPSGGSCASAFPNWVRAQFEEHFTVDNSASSRFRDRMYRVYETCIDSVWRIATTYSSDRGKSWSEPTLLSPRVPQRSLQFLPAMAVNRDGTVMAIWHDTRDSERGNSYHLYASASLDGGKTFLPAVRVSSTETFPESVGNIRQHAKQGHLFGPESGDSGRIFIARQQINETRGAGEYVGLVADAGGVFHPFWVQSRFGTFHVYSAQLRVLRDRAASGCGANTRDTRPLNGLVVLAEPDNPSFDATFAKTQLPVRLRNISTDTLCGPFTLTLASSSRQPGPTAPDLVFAKGGALRDLDYLAPGGTTEPIAIEADLSDSKGDGSVVSRGWYYRVTGRPSGNTP